MYLPDFIYMRALALASICFQWMLSGSDAITLCNRSRDQIISISLGLDREGGEIETAGWIIVPPLGCHPVPVRGLRTAPVTLYVYAETKDGRALWNGEYPMCTRDTAFEFYAQPRNCSLPAGRTRPFTAVQADLRRQTTISFDPRFPGPSVQEPDISVTALKAALEARVPWQHRQEQWLDAGRVQVRFQAWRGPFELSQAVDSFSFTGNVSIYLAVQFAAPLGAGHLPLGSCGGVREPIVIHVGFAMTTAPLSLRITGVDAENRCKLPLTFFRIDATDDLRAAVVSYLTTLAQEIESQIH